MDSEQHCHHKLDASSSFQTSSHQNIKVKLRLPDISCAKFVHTSDALRMPEIITLTAQHRTRGETANASSTKPKIESLLHTAEPSRLQSRGAADADRS
jgi:hypothetical protein